MLFHGKEELQIQPYDSAISWESYRLSSLICHQEVIPLQLISHLCLQPCVTKITFGPRCTRRTVWLWVPRIHPLFLSLHVKRQQCCQMWCTVVVRTGRSSYTSETLLGTIYLLVRSISLTVLPKSWNQINLPVCIDFQLPEILCKNISTYLLDVGLEQGLARYYLEFPSIPSLLGLYATDNSTSSHPHWPC